MKQIPASSDVQVDGSFFVKGSTSAPGPWIDVKALGAKGDGSTDDQPAIQAAITACPSTGCAIFFPSASTYVIGSSTNVNGLTISSSHPGIRLVGECGTSGSSTTCSQLVSAQNIDILTIGDNTTLFRSAAVVQDLGFADISASNNQVKSAIHVEEAEEWNFTNVRCTNIHNNGTSSGICFFLEGQTGSSPTRVTQFGVIINPSVSSALFPIQTLGNVSEINLYGGNLNCSGVQGGVSPIGMDLGKTNHQSGVATGGEWGVYGTHILNCATGVSMYNNSVMQWYGVMEQTGSQTGTGFVIDGDNTSPNPSGSTIGGSINNFSTGVSITGTAKDITLIGTIGNSGTVAVSLSASATNIKILGSLPSTNAAQLSASGTQLSSALILTNTDYNGAGGVAIGSQIPTDVTIPQTSKPTAPVAGSRTLYVDSTSTDLTVERNGGLAIDLENGSQLQFGCAGTLSGVVAAIALWPGTSGTTCSSGNTLNSNTGVPASYTGTATNLACSALVAPNSTSGAQCTFTKAGVATTLKCTIPMNANTCTPDTTDQVSVSQGDLIGCKVNPFTGETMLASVSCAVNLK